MHNYRAEGPKSERTIIPLVPASGLATWCVFLFPPFSLQMPLAALSLAFRRGSPKPSLPDKTQTEKTDLFLKRTADESRGLPSRGPPPQTKAPLTATVATWEEKVSPVFDGDPTMDPRKSHAALTAAPSNLGPCGPRQTQLPGRPLAGKFASPSLHSPFHP